MPYISQIPPDDAEGLTKREYERAVQRAGRIWNIVAIMSQNGAVMRDSMRMYGSTLFEDSPLSRPQREMIAVVTSMANACDY